jgi:hypothetical protein
MPMCPLYSRLSPVGGALAQEARERAMAERRSRRIMAWVRQGERVAVLA